MAVAHLLHGSRRQHRVVILRAERRQVAQEFREVDPLLAEIIDRKIVLRAEVAEILLLRRRSGGHERLELRGLPVPLAETDDAPLDDRPVEPEIGLVGVVVRRDLVVGEDRIDRTVNVMLVQLADQQRLPVLLHHAVDIPGRLGEEDFGLLQLQLLAHPAVHVHLHIGGAVPARQPLRNDSPHVTHAKLPPSGAGDGLVAREIAGHLPATRQQQRTRRDRYFRSQIHIPKGKDRVFTRN